MSPDAERDPAPAAAPSLGSRAMSGAAWMVGFRMLSRLLGMVSTLTLARLLDTSDFGMVAIAFTLSSAFSALSNVGVAENLIRHKSPGRDLLDTGFTLQVIKGVITGAVLLAIAPLAAEWFNDSRLTPVLVVLAAVFVLAGFENVGIIQFRREMRFDREFLLSTVERLSAFAVTLATALWLHSYWAMVLGMAVSKAARLVATYGLHGYRPRFSLRAWRELAGLSLWMWLSSLAYVVWIRADPMVLGSSVSKAAVGVYFLAVEVALLPASEILEPIAGVLFAGFAAERNAGRDPREKAFMLALTLMAIMAPIGLLISANSTYVVGVLLGPKWGEAAPIVAIVALTAILSPYTYMASLILTSIGQLKTNLGVVVAASVIKLVALYFVARSGDLRLIALASLSISSAETVLFVAALRRAGAGLDGLAGPLLRVSASLVVSALAIWATGWGWTGTALVPVGQSVTRGLILGALGASTYAGVMLGLWHLTGRADGPERRILERLHDATLSRGLALRWSR